MTPADLRIPPPGSLEELARFAELQRRLIPLFRRIFPDPREPRTVLVNPSLSLDSDVIANIQGLPHYEERLLCMLLLLRLPRTRVVYVTSMPVDPAIVDYYLHLLPGIPGIHARKRLTMLSCHDGSTGETLTKKLLARPRLLEHLSTAIGDPALAHMTCFNATAAERTLAVRLDIPIFANDPALEHLGSKSGSRHVFREAGVPMPVGCEDLRDVHDVAEGLAQLKRNDPGLRRATVKLEYGTSGEGNALFEFRDVPQGAGLSRWVTNALPGGLQFEEPAMHWEKYAAKFKVMGGIVEAWQEGEETRSPSVQNRITPLGDLEIISTHDQVLGGPSGQVFLGCTFPANDAYRLDIQESGRRIAAVLKERGALGRFGVDFVSVRGEHGWQHYAIEINLRKGGTTHTYRMLQFLTDGTYDEATGLFFTHAGQPRFYYASDNLKHENYKRLAPDDLMDIAVEHGLHFSAATQQGVFFHLIGALSGYGKLGLVCVAASRAAATELYQNTVRVLNEETRDVS
ncbi:MAG: peptide ligase PGM1-related protein [Gammaproteobacteria bacterium]|nr:peptide ligase PGM1-related protein [Gammaproteobacteria bacterium]